MKRISFLTLGVFLVSFSVQAQSENKLMPKTNSDSSTPNYTKKQNGFKTTENQLDLSVKNGAKQSLLQELYSLEDERNRIEKNESLTALQRDEEINQNNANYIAKKEEFKVYVNHKGFLNLSKQEQNYYLSVLKSEGNKEEYTKNINLIKN